MGHWAIYIRTRTCLVRLCSAKTHMSGQVCTIVRSTLKGVSTRSCQFTLLSSRGKLRTSHHSTEAEGGTLNQTQPTALTNLEIRTCHISWSERAKQGPSPLFDPCMNPIRSSCLPGIFILWATMRQKRPKDWFNFFLQGSGAEKDE